MSMNMFDSKAILGASWVEVLRLWDCDGASTCSRALGMLLRCEKPKLTVTLDLNSSGPAHHGRKKMWLCR